MEEIGIFEAKTKLSELCKRVAEDGASYVITRRGRPVARIVGASNSDLGGSGILRRMAATQAELGAVGQDDNDAELPAVWEARRGGKADPLVEGEPSKQA